ncbi:hypothetical protein SDC9_124784 [bioreactor metagenome]|uniref:GP-PDE domain-containing protein n=1 Tax=bioreactor metagenome TaxID=1076179 RepID=A0A645CLC1_9ZZZZ|nr:glycerophosphodiester phosphodiesterase family protein [Erysipelotrichaceae bacterium]
MIFVSILLGLFLLYLFILMPRYTKKKNWEQLSTFNYAHRGLHNDRLPENTLEAYQKAIDHGYGFEFDVQHTKDNILVVMHDFSLKRACGLDKLVSELTYDEIKELTVFGSEYHIPLFTDVLKLADGKVPLVIEIKQNSQDCTTCELVSKYLDSYHGSFCVESFHPSAVKWFRDHRPDWIRGQLSADFSKDDTKSAWLSLLLENLCFNIMTRPDFVAYCVEDIHKFSFRIYRDLLKGNTALWTIRDQKTFTRYKSSHGVLIFENFII